MKSADTAITRSLPTTTPGPITSLGAEQKYGCQVGSPGWPSILPLSSTLGVLIRSPTIHPEDSGSTTHTYKAVLRQEPLRDGKSSWQLLTELSTR